MNKKLIIPFLFVICLLVSCRTGIQDAETVRAVVPSNVPLTAAEIEKLFRINSSKKSGIALEITVYDYSSGAEVIRYSDEGMSAFTKDSRIKMLIKIKRDSKLVKTHFIMATGKTREDLLKNLSHEIDKLK